MLLNINDACFKVLNDSEQLLNSANYPWTTEIINDEDDDASHIVFYLNKKIAGELMITIESPSINKVKEEMKKKNGLDKEDQVDKEEGDDADEYKLHVIFYNRGCALTEDALQPGSYKDIQNKFVAGGHGLGLKDAIGAAFHEIMGFYYFTAISFHPEAIDYQTHSSYDQKKFYRKFSLNSDNIKLDPVYARYAGTYALDISDSTKCPRNVPNCIRNLLQKHNDVPMTIITLTCLCDNRQTAVEFKQALIASQQCHIMCNPTTSYHTLNVQGNWFVIHNKIQSHFHISLFSGVHYCSIPWDEETPASVKYLSVLFNTEEFITNRDRIGTYDRNLSSSVGRLFLHAIDGKIEAIIKIVEDVFKAELKQTNKVGQMKKSNIILDSIFESMKKSNQSHPNTTLIVVRLKSIWTNFYTNLLAQYTLVRSAHDERLVRDVIEILKQVHYPANDIPKEPLCISENSSVIDLVEYQDIDSLCKGYIYYVLENITYRTHLFVEKWSPKDEYHRETLHHYVRNQNVEWCQLFIWPKCNKLDSWFSLDGSKLISSICKQELLYQQNLKNPVTKTATSSSSSSSSAASTLVSKQQSSKHDELSTQKPIDHILLITPQLVEEMMNDEKKMSQVMIKIAQANPSYFEHSFQNVTGIIKEKCSSEQRRLQQAKKNEIPMNNNNNNSNS
jgi:hypothetical protein